MWRFSLIAVVMLIIGQSTVSVSVTAAWKLDPAHNVVEVWDLEADGQAYRCGSVTVTPTERRCIASVPQSATRFRLIGSGNKGWTDWSALVISPPSTGGHPGAFTIQRHVSDVLPPPVMAWTRRHYDTFTGSSLSSLDGHTPDEGTGYTNPAGGGIRPTIDTAGTALRNGGSNGVYITTTIGVDHKIQFVLKTVSGQSDVRLWVRYNVNGGGTIAGSANGYVLRINNNPNEIAIDRWDAGSRTNIVSAITVNWVNDDLVTFEAVGTTIRALRNGVEISGSSVTDATYGTGTVAFSHEVGNDPCADELEVYDDTGAVGQPLMARWLGVPYVGGRKLFKGR